MPYHDPRQVSPAPFTEDEGDMGVDHSLSNASSLPDVSSERETSARQSSLKSFRFTVMRTSENLKLAAVRAFQSDRVKLLRAEAKALWSMADMISDIYMVYRYYYQGETTFSLATAVCLGLNLSAQSILVLLQNRKLTWWRQLKEQAFVWCLIKPGVDIWRVLKKKNEDDAIVNARTEMTGVRIVEMVTESIPGSIIQMLALVQAGGDRSFTPILSLLISISTTALISADMTFAWDVSEARIYDPAFYGFIPSSFSSQVLTAAALFILSICNLIVRALSFALLHLSGGIALSIGIPVLELCAYLLQKAMRRDLTYWPPVYGAAGFFISCVMRGFIFLVVCWTSCAQFRHANEVGGYYWSFTMLSTIVIGLASAIAYEKKEEGDMSEWNIHIVMFASCAGMVLSHVFLMIMMVKKYRGTFFSTQTSSKYIQDLFQNEEREEQKFEIFSYHEAKWRANIGEQVKEWLNERLLGWIEEQPEWFGDVQKAMVPDWVVDDEDLLTDIRNDEVIAIISERMAIGHGRRLSMSRLSTSGPMAAFSGRMTEGSRRGIRG